MTKHLLFALCTCASVALAQTPKPEVITHLNGLDIEISAMGVPTATTEAGGELVGIRAVRVVNRTDEMVTCEFHVPSEARASTSAPPVFNLSPNSQQVERVPGDYSPDEPFAELTCRASNRAVGNSASDSPIEPDADQAPTQ
ncbi:hypothetical protein ACYCFK_12560 [Stutzerimonas stutzeri]